MFPLGQPNMPKGLTGFACFGYALATYRYHFVPRHAPELVQ